MRAAARAVLATASAWLLLASCAGHRVARPSPEPETERVLWESSQIGFAVPSVEVRCSVDRPCPAEPGSRAPACLSRAQQRRLSRAQPSPGCAVGEECVCFEPPFEACEEDADCRPGSACALAPNPTPARCAELTGVARPERVRQCQPLECADAAGCPAHFDCVEGRCRRRRCDTNAECADGHCIATRHLAGPGHGTCHAERGTCARPVFANPPP